MLDDINTDERVGWQTETLVNNERMNNYMNIIYLNWGNMN